MRSIHGCWAVLLLGALTACDPPSQPGPTASATATASQRAPVAPAASSAAGAASTATYADEDLPVAADFEAAAEKEIDEGNYLDKLGEIEAALDGNAPGAKGDAGTSQ